MTQLQKFLLILVFIIIFSVPIIAQQSETLYIYDDKGRLIAVISPTGEANVYQYDAAGNFVSIRKTVSNSLEFFSFEPHAGLPGTTVTLYGVGFNSAGSVLFNGVAANIISSTNNVIVTKVPAGTTSGLITVNTPLGTVNSPIPFLIQGIMIDPINVTIQEGETQQFTAQASVPGTNQDVQWSVNGIPGGNGFYGRITASGLYTAPEPLDSSIDVFVRATSTAFPNAFGEAAVHVQSLNNLRFSLSGAVSIGRGENFNQPTFGQPVSVGRGENFNQLSQSQGVSLAKAPVISTILPATARRGMTTNITVTGANLNGVNSIILINPGSGADSTITISNINVNAQGTSLTANLIVGASSVIGKRILVVRTATTRSTTADFGINTINIVQ